MKTSRPTRSPAEAPAAASEHGCARVVPEGESMSPTAIVTNVALGFAPDGPSRTSASVGIVRSRALSGQPSKITVEDWSSNE
jgi:hypothetical protein